MHMYKDPNLISNLLEEFLNLLCFLIHRGTRRVKVERGQIEGTSTKTTRGTHSPLSTLRRQSVISTYNPSMLGHIAKSILRLLPIFHQGTINL